MPKYIFKKLKDENNDFDTTTVELTVESENLGDVVEAFEEFLRGSGFHPRGSLDFIEDDND